MIEIKVEKKDSGGKSFKYLKKLLPSAPNGLIYKQLRNKNITINGKKADGNEVLSAGDVIKLFFSDATYQKFHSPENASISTDEYFTAYSKLHGIEILYEDENIAALSKPAGILSQKSTDNDSSLNEWWIGYLLESKTISVDDMQIYKPSVMNRLDRNTSGIVLAAKTLLGSVELSRLIKEHKIGKFYRTYLIGNLPNESDHLIAYLRKDESTNTVKIITDIPDNIGHSDDYSKIETKYRVINCIKHSKYNITYAEIELLTGKTHQIRAHLSAIGCPIVGDPKYGQKECNEYFQKLGIRNQLLHSYRVEFPADCGKLSNLCNTEIICKEPKYYGNMEK